MNPINQIALGDIRIDTTQTRVEINEETVSEYAELMKSKVELPPVVVFSDGDIHWLADGFHRYHAAKRRKLESILCDIREGTERDALEFALGANAEHGLRRSRDDKRRSVEIALADEEWGRLPVRTIAAKCRVSHTFVNNLRQELKGTSSEASETESSEATDAADGNLRSETESPQAVRISGGTSFDTNEIEAAPKRKPPENGTSPTPANTREITLKLISQLGRNIHELGLLDEFDECLSGLLKRVRSL